MKAGKERKDATGLLPESPLHRRVFIVCMALVAVSAVLNLIWAAQRHF